MDKSNSRSNWGRFLLIWALVLLLLGTAGCFVLYRYLGVYEVTRPEPVMDDLLETRDAQSLIREAKEHVDFPLTEFEDASVLYSEYLDAIDLTKPLSYRPVTGKNTESERCYLVRAGTNNLCTVLLEQEGSTLGFGRHAWQVSEIQAAPITDILPSVTVRVDALSGQVLYLNGKVLYDAYLTDENIPIEDLTQLESRFDPLPHFVRYTVGPLYGEVCITDAEGRSLAPAEEGSGSLLYKAAYPTHWLTIQAPADLKILVSGAELTSRDAVSSDYGVLAGLEAYSGDAGYLTNVYRFENLYSVPKVVAISDNATEVLPIMQSESSYAFFHESDPAAKEELLPIAERFFDSYLSYSAHAYDPYLFTTLLNQILPGTQLHTYISTTRDTMLWAGSSTDVGEMQYENFQKISPTCFVCTVVYNIDRTSQYWNTTESTTQSGAYELAFVSTSGRWYCAAMNIISA